MEDQRFDELTKRLARPVSRRQVLKVIAAATMGGIFARSGTGRAFASTPCTPNNACAHFCSGIFGGDTVDQSACASEATKCQGLCWTCGPGANPSNLTPCPGGTLPGTSFRGHCANLQTDSKNCGACNHVCPSGQFCCGGKCIPNCTAQDQCHVAGVCNPSTQTCTNPPKTNGTACTGTNECFQTYTCQSGVCTGSNPVICPACQVCSGGTCIADTSANGTSCGTDLVCQNGSCVACGGVGQPCCANSTCPVGGTCCNGSCCPGTCCNGSCCPFTCCTDATPNYCCFGSCCNGTCCVPGAICCTDATPNYCCGLGQSCSGGICCSSGEINCNGSCCIGTCCNDATPNYCCFVGSCCNGSCCLGQSCSGGVCV